MAVVIRNQGAAPLPADTARGAALNLAGLDFLAGDTLPRIPGLEPGASAVFRWQVQPVSADAPLVTAFVLRRPDAPPVVRVEAIHHLTQAPGPESPAVSSLSARASSGEGIIENRSLRARLYSTPAGIPFALLSVRAGGAWRACGASLPLAEALTAEPGQRPWWESFKIREVTARSTKDSAVLTLKGRIGVRWDASVELTLTPDSRWLWGSLELSGRRPLRLHGLRFLPFMAGAGSWGAVSSEPPQGRASGQESLTAVRWGEIVTVAARPLTPPLEGWRRADLSVPGGVDYTLLAEEWRSGSEPAVLEKDTVVRASARLGLIFPSASIDQALLP